MNKPEAHALLNAAASGLDVPDADITRALFVTGDLGGRRMPKPGPVADAEDDGPTFERVVTSKPAGSWERGACGPLASAGPFDGLVAA